MERLTVPDERIDEHTTRRTVIDADKVREHAMDFYWALKRYEDTFLTPEEITKIRADVENGYLKSTARRYGVPVDRLRELAQADREERVVVLPCKLGDTVYRIVKFKRTKNWKKEANFIRAVELNRNNFWDIVFGGLIGRTVFLTREEAEKALEGDAGDEQA